MANLVDGMKRVAIGAVESTKPVALLFGVVVSVAPLRVCVEQKMTLEAAQLIPLRGAVSLTVGARVLLLREQGGQRFAVLGVVE